MTAKEMLMRYQKAKREAKDIEIRLTELRLKYAYPSAIKYSDMPTAHDSNHDLSDYASKLDELEQMLINIPIQINGQVWNLRCGFSGKNLRYDVYGLWEGYDSQGKMFNRNVKSLAQFAGQEFRLLYEQNRDPETGRISYAASEPQRMTRGLMLQYNRVRVLETFYDSYGDSINDHEAIVDAIRQQESRAAEKLVDIHLGRWVENERKLRKQYPEYFLEEVNEK